MSVIINEFEVVPEQKREVAPPEPPAAGPGPDVAEEIERIVRRLREREDRLRAT